LFYQVSAEIIKSASNSDQFSSFIFVLSFEPLKNPVPLWREISSSSGKALLQGGIRTFAFGELALIDSLAL